MSKTPRIRRNWMVVQIACARRGIPHSRRLRTWAQAALHAGKKLSDPLAGMLTVRFVDTGEARALNAHWRKKNYPTNVLSFPAQEFFAAAGSGLGDIVICMPVVKREARAQGKTLPAHIAHLLIHGILHLLGYDHMRLADAQRMERLEIQLLRQLGFANPYEIR